MTMLRLHRQHSQFSQAANRALIQMGKSLLIFPISMVMDKVTQNLQMPQFWQWSKLDLAFFHLPSSLSHNLLSTSSNIYRLNFYKTCCTLPTSKVLQLLYLECEAILLLLRYTPTSRLKIMQSLYTCILMLWWRILRIVRNFPN